MIQPLRLPQRHRRHRRERPLDRAGGGFLDSRAERAQLGVLVHQGVAAGERHIGDGLPRTAGRPRLAVLPAVPELFSPAVATLRRPRDLGLGSLEGLLCGRSGPLGPSCVRDP